MRLTRFGISQVKNSRLILVFCALKKNSCAETSLFYKDLSITKTSVSAKISANMLFLSLLGSFSLYLLHCYLGEFFSS